MKIHLSWDGQRGNGVVFNATYTDGVLIAKPSRKPILAFDYISLSYSEVFPNPNFVIQSNGIKRKMTPEEETEVKNIAINWVQDYGYEGNSLINPVEVALESGQYKKHVKRSNGNVRGFSYNDPSYNVVYESYPDGSMKSKRKEGEKIYHPFTSGAIPNEISAYSQYITMQGSYNNETEYYMDIPNIELVNEISTALSLSNPYTQSQIDLIEADPLIYRVPTKQTKYFISIKFIDLIPTTITGFMTMSDPEILNNFGINASSFVQPEVPTLEITPSQFRLQLLEEGLLSNVSQKINSLPSPTKDRVSIEWEYATTVKRSNSSFKTILSDLGKTDIEMDIFYNNAGKL